MRRPGIRGVLLLLIAAAVCLRMAGDAGVHTSPPHIAFPGAMPQTVLWAWEEPENLAGVNPRQLGIAYLAETLLLGNSIRVVPRHQPLIVPRDAPVMAVVRIETLPGFRDGEALRKNSAALLAEVTRQHPLHALQIDFDATLSERPFYAAVLTELRLQMPRGLPLSITALASWCTSDPQQGWLSTLPIDEAVPMLFRLGGHARPNDSKDYIVLREPLCRGSVGLSTDESWPSAEEDTPRRIYLFSPRPWQPAEISAAALLRTAERPSVLWIGGDPAHPGINDSGLRRSASNSDLSPEARP